MKNSRETSRLTLVVLSVAAALGTTAHAQSTALDEVVVTANKLILTGIGDDTGFGVLGNRKVVDTPFSVTAFTEGLIENLAAQNLIDVLTRDASVSTNVNYNGYRDEVDIRGFFVNKATYLYDGVPGLITTDGYVGLGNVEAVEIFRGVNAFNSGGATYGGVGGTINVVPKRPTSDVSQVTLGYQSNHPILGFDFARRYGSNETVGLRFTGYSANGRLAVNDVERQSENYALYADWVPNDDLYVAFEYTRFRSRTEAYLDNIFLSAGVPLPEPPELDQSYSQPWAWLESSGDRIYSKVSWDITEDWTFSAGAGYSEGDRANGYVSAFALVTDVNGTLNRLPQGVRQPISNHGGGQITVDGHFDVAAVRNKVILSATYSRRELQYDYSFANPVAGNLYVRQVAPDPGIIYSYLLDYVEIDDVGTLSALYEGSVLDGRLSLIAGAREIDIGLRANYDRYEDSRLSPFGSVYFKPTGNSTVYVSYTEGLERGGTAPAAASNANEQLPPGVNKQVELGGKLQVGDLLLTAAAFEIIRPLNFLNSSNLFVNDGEQTHRGAELQLAGDLTADLRLITGVTFLDAEVDNGNPAVRGNRPAGVPEWAAAFYGEYDLPGIRGLTLTAGVNYQSNQFVDVRNVVTRREDGWTTLDLGGRYAFSFADTPLVMRLMVTNLTEEKYWSIAHNSGLQLANPRMFRISVTADL